MKTYCSGLMTAIILCLMSVESLDYTFEEMLKIHGINRETIKILEENKIVDIAVALSLSETDILDLGLLVGQRSLLREFVKKLQLSSNGMPKSTSSSNQEEEEVEEFSEQQFWCIFKCLGGISAVGIGGILALVGLVTYGLPLIGFTAVGIAAGSLAASIMSLYGGAVGAGSVVSVLQSVAMAGIGWKAILGAFFGPAAVMSAVKNACSHCMDP